MAWIDPHNSSSYPQKIDINQKFFDELRGELTDEQARATLAEFLYYNLQFTTRILTGMILRPFQAVIIKGWFEKNYSLACYGRGLGKSTLAGIFAVLYAIFNPGTRILIVSSNFRSSRRILETLDSMSKKKEGLLMKQCFATDLSRRNDIFQWLLKNGSSIVCLPLASGEGLRGQRANVLIMDEALLISKQIIENVLMPFLAVKSTDFITEIAKVREIEDQLIADDKMKEEDRQKFKSKNKMLMLSSASYTGEYFHEVYLNYLKKIQGVQESKDPNKKKLDIDGEEEVSHFVSQLSYEVMAKLAPDIMDKGIIKEVESGDVPENVIDREYRAKFVSDSGGLFRMARMKKCTIPDGQKPCVEIVGEPDARYYLGVDPNVSGSEIADHFAMSLLKEVTKPNGKKVGMLVHSYAACAVDLKDHINYLLYILEHFNVVYIGVDASQGDNMDFINVCNESDIFKNKNINLLPIDAEFGKEDQAEIAKQVKKSYNLNQKRIVQKQVFHSAFQSAAVDSLQACIDFENIIFAGKALAVDGLAGIMAEQDIGTIHKTHKQFADESTGDSVYSFIERQDYLIDLTKYECSLIVVSISSLGNKSYSLPIVYQKSKSTSRPRKDSFSSLMLANWCFKIHGEAEKLPDEEEFGGFAPMLI
jgi:hypothetical protein